MDLHTEGLDIVGAIGASSEVGQIELDLVPSFVQTHRHGADEWFHSGCALVVTRSESATHILVVKHLHFEGEVLLEILDDHNEERQFDSECFVGVGGTGDVVGGHIGSHDF